MANAMATSIEEAIIEATQRGYSVILFRPEDSPLQSNAPPAIAVILKSRAGNVFGRGIPDPSVQQLSLLLRKLPLVFDEIDAADASGVDQTIQEWPTE